MKFFSGHSLLWPVFHVWDEGNKSWTTTEKTKTEKHKQFMVATIEIGGRFQWKCMYVKYNTDANSLYQTQHIKNRVWNLSEKVSTVLWRHMNEIFFRGMWLEKLCVVDFAVQEACMHSDKRLNKLLRDQNKKRWGSWYDECELF